MASSERVGWNRRDEGGVAGGAKPCKGIWTLSCEQ